MITSIAVVLPTCNRFGMLTRTLRSLERQTHKDFTVYVSDDASTDETKDHDASSFPSLQIRWIRRPEKFPDIAAHFSALYAEATEDGIALAHDDEVYAPQWLETLVALTNQPSPSGSPIVMAQVGTVMVDARRDPVIYYRRKDQIPDGLYVQEELKRRCLFDGWHFSSNGFLVTREAARQTGSFDIGYEQFDFEWLMRLAGQGLTACSTRLLHTYTMHPENTVGSARYFQRYFEQKNSTKMRQEWLESLSSGSGESIRRKREELRREYRSSRFKTYLKLVATGDHAACRVAIERLRADADLGPRDKKAARLLANRLLFCLASVFLRVILKRQQKRRHASLQPLSEAEWEKDYPETCLVHL